MPTAHHDTSSPALTDEDALQPISGASSAPAEDRPVDGIPDDLASPAARIAVLEAELAALREAQLYAKAEAENARRRAQEELAAAHKYAISRLARELLPVRDCLEMVVKDTQSTREQIHTGVEMTLRNLGNAFEQFQIREIVPAIGEKLDPNKHQAMSVVPSEQELNTVVSLVQKGYQIAERVLRPAVVVVAQPPAVAEGVAENAPTTE